MQRYLSERSDSFGGDPVKVAQAIVRIASEHAPPLRLLAGSDAVFLARQSAQVRAEEDARWEPLSRSTDFDDAPDFLQSSVASLVIEKTS